MPYLSSKYINKVDHWAPSQCEAVQLTEHQTKHREIIILFLALPLACWMVLAKVFSGSVPWFFHLYSKFLILSKDISKLVKKNTGIWISLSQEVGMWQSMRAGYWWRWVQKDTRKRKKHMCQRKHDSVWRLFVFLFCIILQGQRRGIQALSSPFTSRRCICRLCYLDINV